MVRSPLPPFDIFFPFAERPMLHSQGLTWANGVRNAGRNKAQIRGTTGWKEEKRSKPDSWLYHRYIATGTKVKRRGEEVVPYRGPETRDTSKYFSPR